MPDNNVMTTGVNTPAPSSSDNKVNDWVVASLMNPQTTYAGFQQQGITPDNTQLQPKSYYEDNDNIKKIFTGKDGNFDQTQFDKFYDINVATFNQFSNKAFNQTIIDNAPTYYKDQLRKPQDAQVMNQQSVLQDVSNPFKKKTGFDGFGVISDPTLSIRELAQQNQVKDSTTGKDLGWTPNDDDKSGLFDFWFTPTVAVAQYDEDGTHYDPMQGREVKHKKGDYKTNETGDFYYETLGDRESYGKQVLSVWDTNTTDGSFANKFDFMDSDGLTKSFTGNVVKTAAQVLPYFIPGVGEVYGGMQIGLALAEALPAVAKGVSGIFLNDSQKDTSYYKAMNDVQGFAKRFTAGGSDASKTSSFNSENILQMVSDTFGMLYLQKNLAAIPQLIGASSKEAAMVSRAAKSDPMIAEWLSKELGSVDTMGKAAGDSFEEIQQSKDLLYHKAIQLEPGLEKVLENATKWTNTASMGLSTAYLSATMSMGVVEKAKEMGLDERDTGALLLGSMATLGAFITYAPIGHWVLNGMGLDEVGLAAKESVKAEGGMLQKSLQDIDDAIMQKAALPGNTAESLKIARINKIFNVGKQFGKTLAAKLNDQSYLGKALAEGVAMVTQDGLMDTVKVGYNALNALGLTSTNDPNKSFEFTPQDLFQRYAMSFFGGALGGVMFLGHDRLMSKMTSATSEQDKKDMFYFVRNGMKQQYLDVIAKEEKKGTLGNKALSPLVFDTTNNITDSPVYKPAETSAQSQNSIIANMLRGQVEYLDRIIKQEDLPSDKRIQDVYEKRYQTAIDLKLNTAIRDDVQELSSDIINKINDIKGLPVPDKEAPNFDHNAYSTKVNKLNGELLYMKEQMRQIADGEKYAQYFGEALFNMNGEINKPFGIKSKNDFAIATYGKPQWELDDVQKQAIEDKYAVFTQYQKRQQLRLGKELFDQTHTETNKWIPQLASYADQKQGYFNTYADVNATLDQLHVNEQNVDQVNTKRADLDVFRESSVLPNENAIDYLLRVQQSQKYIHPEVTAKLLKEFENLKADRFLANNGTTTRGALTDVMDKLGYSHVTDDIETNFDFQENPEYLGLHRLNDMHVGNVDKIVDEIKQTLSRNKDEIDRYATEPDTVQALRESLDHLKGYINEINPEFADYNYKAEQLVHILKSKENSPLYDLLKKTAIKVEGASVSNILDVIQTEFKNLSEREDPSKFVLDNNVKYEQLAQAKDLLDKLHASLRASASFTYTDEPFGYNLAINKVKKAMGDKILFNNLSVDQFYTLDNEVKILQAKIDFLTNLSRINEGSKIKNMKLASGVMRSLFVDSLGPDSEVFPILENAGVDTTQIRAAYANASNLNNWIDSIRDDENKTPLPSKDADLSALEKETSEIERSFYDAINANSDKKYELLNAIQHGFDLSKLVLSHEDKTNFSHTAKSVTYYDSYMYFNMIANVDGGEFLNDFRGAKDAQGIYDLEKSKYAPFYGQEYALKMAYWLMQAQSEGINSVNMSLNRMTVPAELKTDEEKEVFKNSLYKSLFNTIFINGIPGSGKTTGILNYIARIAAKHGYTIAAYGPHQEQGQNLRESLGSIANVINNDMHVKGLLHSIMPDGLYERIQQQIEEQGWDTNVIDRDNPSTFKSDKLLVLDTVNENKGYDIRLNPHHPDIAEFLSGDKLTSITAEGKAINMLFIDEATHLSSVDLQILNEAIRIHNDKNANKIGLYLTGDSEQRGYTMEFPQLSKGNVVNTNLNMFSLFKTPTLSESLRTGYNIKSKNIDIIRAYRQQYDDIIKTSGDANLAGNVKNYIEKELISLEYTEDNDELIGDKLVDSIEKPDIDKMLAKIGLDKTGKPNKIGIIVSNLEGPLTRLVKTYPDWETKFDIKTPDRVQGLEYEAIAIDVDPTVVGTTNVNSAIRALEMLYTMTTRSKKASLINNNIVNGMNLESTSKDVFAVKTQLDSTVIEAYKKFRLDSINLILNDIGSSQFNTKPVVVAKPLPLKSRSLTTTPEEEEKFLSLVLGGASGDSDSAGNPVQNVQTREKLILYPYHERLQLLSDMNDKIVSVIDNKDLSFVYKLLYPGGKLEGKMLDSDEVMEARRALKVFKSAIYNYSNYKANPENKLDLEDYFNKYTNLHPDLLDKFDFANIQLGIESKLYIPNSDSDKGVAFRKEYGGGISHFQVARVPLEDGTIGEITLAAFPNPANPNVNKLDDVMSVINDLNTRFNKAKLDEGGDNTYTKFTPYKSGLRVEDIARPYNNLEIKPGVKGPLDEYMENNPHLRFSDVHILSNAKMFNQGDDTNVDLAIKNLVGDNTDKDNKVNKYSAKLLGRAVVFVTYDTTKAPSVLSEDFQAQFIDSIRNGNDPANRETQDTIKMIPLNTTGLKLTELIQKNKEIVYGMKSETDLDSKVQKLAYGNKYLAARILNSIYNTDVFIKKNVRENNFDLIRKSLQLDSDVYTDDRIRDLSVKNASLLTTVFQILGTTDNALSIREPGTGVLASLAKNYYSEIVSQGKDESDGVRKAFPKAAAHYYTKEFIVALDKTIKPSGFVADNSVLRTLEDNDGNSMFLEFQHSEPFNVLVALRAALEGGRWKTPEGQRASFGMFPEGSEEGKASYYNFLDKMLVKEFPDGLYINPVIRRATEENQLPDGLLAYPAGNPTRHFTIDARINEFKSLFNIDHLELRSPDEIERTLEQHKQIINNTMLDVKSMIDSEITPNISLGMSDAISHHYTQYSREILNNSDPDYIKNASDNISATRNKLLEAIKSIIDDGTSINKLVDGQKGLTIIKNVDISDGHTIKLEALSYDSALEKQVSDIAASKGIPREDVTVVDSGVSKDSPINYVLENNKTNERIAKFVFSEGEFKNVLPTTTDDNLAVIKDAAFNKLNSFRDDLFNSVHSFIREDVTEFFNHIDNIKTLGSTSSVDIDTQLKLGSKYLMISASLSGNNKTQLLETFNEGYKDFIEHYKC